MAGDSILFSGQRSSILVPEVFLFFPINGSGDDTHPAVWASALSACACFGPRLWPPSQSCRMWPLSLTALEEEETVVEADQSIGSGVRCGLHATVLVTPPGQSALHFVCKDQLSPRRASAIRPYRSVDHGSRGGRGHVVIRVGSEPRDRPPCR